MPSGNDAGRTAKRLMAAVGSAEDAEGRTRALAGFLSDLEPGAATSVIDHLVRESCELPDAGLAFLTLLDYNALKMAAGEWEWDELASRLREELPELHRVWRSISGLSGNAGVTVRAKIALLIEIHYVLSEEVLHGGTSGLSETGLDIAARILGKGSPEDGSLMVSVNDYPVECRKPLREILTELDFIERQPGVFRFTFSRSMLETVSSGKSLASHKGTTKLSQALASRSAENVVKRLELMVRTMQMFPSDHPSIGPAVESLLSMLGKFLQESDMVTITVVGESVMVNDTRVKRSSRAVMELIQGLVDRKISSISFSKDVTADELLGFAAIFNRPPGYIAEHGGFSRMLELKEIRSISVNRFHYELISGDEQEGPATLGAREAALEDAIFSELLHRLESGEDLGSISARKIGRALQEILTEGSGDRRKQRGLLARFMAALDPSLLEGGLLGSAEVQRSMSWSAMRKIITGHLSKLTSRNSEVRHRSADVLRDMAVAAVERGKDNTVLQVVETVSKAIEKERDPDVLFLLVSVIGSIVQALVSRGMMSIAVESTNVIRRLQKGHYKTQEVDAARVRALAEFRRRMDTAMAAGPLVDMLLAEDEVSSREARKLLRVMPCTNVVSRLTEVFREDDRHRRARAFRELVRLGERALPQLRAWLEELGEAGGVLRDQETGMLADGDWYVTRNVIQAVRDIGSGECDRVLEGLCADPDPRIRREGLSALARRSPGEACGMSLQLLRDQDPEVAGLALDIVSPMAAEDPRYVHAMLEAFCRNPGVRRKVMKVLVDLGPDREVMELLLRELGEVGEELPFGCPQLASGAMRILGMHGGERELTALEGYLERVTGGFLKKSRVDGRVISAATRARDSIRSRLGPREEPAAGD